MSSLKVFTIDPSGQFPQLTNSLSVDSVTGSITVASPLAGASPLSFEGLTQNTVTTTLAVTDPTVARTITLPDASGTTVLVTAPTTQFAIARFSDTTGYFIENTDLLLTTGTTTQNRVSVSVDETNYALVVAPNGTGSLLSRVPDGTATGGNARGSFAIDLQRGFNFSNDATRVASGEESVLVGGNSNQASAARSIVLGGRANICSGANSVIVQGVSTTVTSQYGFMIGHLASVSGDYAACLAGFANSATAKGAVALGGQYAVADHIGEVVTTSNRFTTSGDAQQSLVTWLRQTTDATVTELTLDGAAPSGATNRYVLASGAKYTGQLSVVASTAAGVTAWWQIVFGIKNIAGVTALVSDTVLLANGYDAAAETWAVSVTADDTNDSLKIDVTGAASTTINWVASGHLIKVQN